MSFSSNFYSSWLRLVFSFLALTHCQMQSANAQAEELPCYVCDEVECLPNPNAPDCVQEQAQDEFPEGFIPPAPEPNSDSESQGFEALQTPPQDPEPAETTPTEKPTENPDPGKCLVLAFTASWCGPCKKLKAEVFTPLFKELEKEYIVGLHLIDMSENPPELSERDLTYFNKYFPGGGSIPKVVGIIEYVDGTAKDEKPWWDEHGYTAANYPKRFTDAIKAKCQKRAK